VPNCLWRQAQDLQSQERKPLRLQEKYVAARKRTSRGTSFLRILVSLGFLGIFLNRNGWLCLFQVPYQADVWAFLQGKGPASMVHKIGRKCEGAIQQQFISPSKSKRNELPRAA